jgi:1-acyl-sn-glycerol-3-phosphate acyltransferase
VSIDGFPPDGSAPFVSFSEKTAEAVYGFVSRMAERLEVPVLGLSHLPKGRGLIVGNHAFGWDVVVPMATIWAKTGRRVWALGEHLWWRVPYVRKLVAELGTVDGTPENVDALLSRDELVLVMPGGLREAVKPRELRYRLLWGERYGFVEAAIRNEAPVVPLASVGADEWFDFVGNATARGERWLRGTGIPLPVPARVLPIPRIVPWRFVLGEPVLPRYAPGAASDRAALRSLRREVEGALSELIDAELCRRQGIDLGKRPIPRM